MLFFLFSEVLAATPMVTVAVDRYGASAPGNPAWVDTGSYVTIQVHIDDLYGVNDAWFAMPDPQSGLLHRTLKAHDGSLLVVVPNQLPAVYVWSATEPAYRYSALNIEEANEKQTRRCMPANSAMQAAVNTRLQEDGKVWRCPIAPSRGFFYLKAGETWIPYEVHGMEEENLGMALQTGKEDAQKFQVDLVNWGSPTFPITLLAKEDFHLDFSYASTVGGSAITQPLRSQDWSVLPALDMPSVQISYGLLVRDELRSVYPTVQIAPIFGPKSYARWPDFEWWKKNLLTVEMGLRLGGEDIVGLTVGPGLNLVPGLTVFGGLEFGTRSLSEPWRFQRAIAVGIGLDPTIMTRVMGYQKERNNSNP